LHALPPLVAGLLLLHRAQGEWQRELAGCALILLGFVKPTISAPFFWLAVFVPQSLRPALWIVAGYFGLSLIAISVQEGGLISLLQQWGSIGLAPVTQGAPRWSYGNLHSLGVVLGHAKWVTTASLLLLAGHGLWAYRYRRGDLWLLLGVTALVARFCTYHAIYDDVLVLLPMVALFRLAKQSPAADGSDVIAGVLFAVMALAMLAPARIQLWPAPWGPLFTVGRPAVWIVVLIFLLERTHRQRIQA
jgi:hypothetical protein